MLEKFEKRKVISEWRFKFLSHDQILYYSGDSQKKKIKAYYRRTDGGRSYTHTLKFYGAKI